MDEEFKIFQKSYNKTLDLISDVDFELTKKYMSLIKFLPKGVIEKIATCEDFNTDVENNRYYAEMLAFNNSLDFDFTRYRDYLRVEFKICRFFVEQLYEKDPIELFNFKYRNEETKQPELRVYLEERDGKLVYVGNNNKAKPTYKDIEYQVFIENSEGKYFIVSRKMSRGWVVYEKKYEAYLDELIQCAETEDEFIKDEPIEFEADFDIPND